MKLRADGLRVGWTRLWAGNACGDPLFKLRNLLRAWPGESRDLVAEQSRARRQGKQYGMDRSCAGAGHDSLPQRGNDPKETWQSVGSSAERRQSDNRFDPTVSL